MGLIDRLAARSDKEQHGQAVLRLADGGVAILHAGNVVEVVQRQLLRCAHGLIAGEMEVIGLEPVDEFVHRLGGAQLGLDFVDAVRLGFDLKFLQAVDATVLEQGGLLVVVLADLVGRRLGDALADVVDIGTGDDFPLGRLDLLHHARVAIELQVLGLLHGQFLLDQAFQNLLAGGLGLVGAQSLLMLQNKIDLMNRDLFLVHLRRGLGSLVGLVAAASQQNGHRSCSDQRDGATADSADASAGEFRFHQIHK